MKRAKLQSTLFPKSKWNGSIESTVLALANLTNLSNKEVLFIGDLYRQIHCGVRKPLTKKQLEWLSSMSKTYLGK